MTYDDTEMGGEDKLFPKTTYRLLARLAHPSDRERAAGLEALCSRYWKPVYRHLRIAWNKPNDDAKDLTQAFFLWLLEGDALAKYVPGRGSFRRYLKILLGGFVGHEREAMQRLKRGGGKRILPLDDPVFADVAASASADPARAFDRAWTSEVVKRALERVRQELLASGRELQMRVYDAYEGSTEAERPTYAQVAASLGIKESDVRNHLFEARELLRRHIRAELMDTTSGEAELQDEWNELFGS